MSRETLDIGRMCDVAGSDERHPGPSPALSTSRATSIKTHVHKNIFLGIHQGVLTCATGVHINIK